MGMNHFGEIRTLTNIAKPTTCVITNIGTAHIGNLGSRENILKAKLEILEGMSSQGTVIINNDNDLLNDWFERNKDKVNIITYGIENKSNYNAYKIIENEKESIFNVKIEENEEKIMVPVPGRHFVLNALCALSVRKII